MAKDEDGPPARGQFSHSSDVGMLLYLTGHTCTDIEYSVNYCTQYLFAPNNFHELELKWIGCYLKATTNKGLVLNPSSLMCKIDCFPDAEFYGSYGHEKPTDP